MGNRLIEWETTDRNKVTINADAIIAIHKGEYSHIEYGYIGMIKTIEVFGSYDRCVKLWQDARDTPAGADECGVSRRIVREVT